jgi:hypothetical protein
MKHHDPARPIGKCKGCCLNRKTTCAAGLEPKAQWARGRCRLHDNREAMRQIQESGSPTGAKAARNARQTKAVAAKSVPHHDGHIFTPARRAGGVPAPGLK